MPTGITFVESLQNTVATDPRDWSLGSRDAWIYGVVVGWDDALRDVAEMHGWNEKTQTRLQKLHRQFVESRPHPDSDRCGDCNLHPDEVTS